MNTLVNPPLAPGRPYGVPTEPYNIEWEGASRSAPNNTPAIQRAIDRVEAAGGGTVFVPPGVWNFHNAVLGDGVELIGTTGSVLRVMDGFRRAVWAESGTPNVKSGIGPRRPRPGDRGPVTTHTFAGIPAGTRGIRYCAIRSLELDGNLRNNPTTGLLQQDGGATDELIFAHPGYIFGPFGHLIVDRVYAHDVAYSIIVTHNFPSSTSLVELLDCHTHNSATDAHLYLNGASTVVRRHLCTGHALYPYVQGYGGFIIDDLAFRDLTVSPRSTTGKMPTLVAGSHVDQAPSRPRTEGRLEATRVRAEVDLALFGDNLFDLGSGVLRAEVVDIGTDADAFISSTVLAASGINNTPSTHLDARVAVRNARRGLGAVKSYDTDDPQRFTKFTDSTLIISIAYRPGLVVDDRGGAALVALGRCDNTRIDVTTSGSWAPNVGVILTGVHEPVRGCTISGTMRPRQVGLMKTERALHPQRLQVGDLTLSGTIQTDLLDADALRRIRRVAPNR